jgi:hypothetical protein
MTKHIELRTVHQGTALTTGSLTLPALVIEGLEEFKGSFDRLCLRAGTAAIEAMLAADAEQLCGKRYQRHTDRQGHRWGSIVRSAGMAGRLPSGGLECVIAAESSLSFPVGPDLLSRWAFQPDADRRGDAFNFQRGAAAKAEGETMVERIDSMTATIRLAGENLQCFSALWRFEQGQED